MKKDRRQFLQGLLLVSAGALVPMSCASINSTSTAMSISAINKRPKLLIFDVNETLLDLNNMKSRMNKAFGHEFAFTQWFSLMLQYSLVDNLTGQYHPFGEIGKAAFQMTEEMLSKKVPDAERDEILQMIKTLPPHPDVKQALESLKKAGYRMVTLTNSTEEVVKEQMKSAGLDQYFERLLSIDPMRKYKPALETYRQATSQLNVAPGEAMLIAAHGWDITGALHAGLQAAFVAREGKAQYPLAPTPAYSEKNLIQLAEHLVKL